MKCPNCGGEMQRGLLYCEHCGEDIHIVPDFEPEIELNMEQAIHNIVEDITVSEELQQQKQHIQKKKGRRSKSHKDRSLNILLVLGGVFILFLYFCIKNVTLAYQQHYQDNSFSWQLEEARLCVQNQQYENAVVHYNRAIELGEKNIQLMLELSEVFFSMENREEYERILLEILAEDNLDSGLRKEIYGKLITFYEEASEYKKINELLLSCNNEEIWNTYLPYLSEPPEFSIQKGYYTDVQPLKLTASGVGKIYYTLDGAIEESVEYTMPILLEEGSHVVQAYFLNARGIKSETIKMEYHIEIEKLPIPEVQTGSGTYQVPVMISVVNDGAEIYYTTDGTIPTKNSSLYKNPIHMPLGKSTFKFIRIAEGKTSDVVVRTYNLALNTEMTKERAEEIVRNYFLETGKIYDIEGRFEESENMYKYQYQYVMNLNGIDDFFVVAEVFRTAENILSLTGNYFAVNAYTEQLYGLQVDAKNNYSLIEM